MEQTTPKVEPLVSDEDMRDHVKIGFSAMFGASHTDVKGMAKDQIRDLYEADRTKTRAVVQAGVNAANAAVFPNVISADDLALIGMLGAGSEKSVALVRETVETYRAAQESLRTFIALAKELNITPKSE